MDRNAVIDVLTKISAYDRRNIGEGDVAAFGEVLERNAWITPALALEAVARHFAESADWLMPAHLVKQARAAKAAQERAQARLTALEAKPAPTTHPGAFRARNPQKWDFLYREGRIDGATSRARAQAKLEDHDPDVAEMHARDWINARLEAEKAGQPERVPAYMPWPPK